VLAAILSRVRGLSPSREGEGDLFRFEALVTEYAPALSRLTLGYEASPEARRDLHQEILVALWRALPGFEGRSSIKTWVLRVAHNVAASHALRAHRRRASQWRSLEELGELRGAGDEESALSRLQLDELARRVRELKPLDRQLVLLFLEGFSPQEMAEVTGLSETNVTTKLSRLRAALRGRLDGGPSHG
jgi:RNA polymerase sigma-70 factor (ECF subfamily)